MALKPLADVRFKSSPARSLHAALLRRLELVAPDIARALHDAPLGAHSSEHPWTVSSLLGPLNHDGDDLVATPDRTYHVRITALIPEVARALDIAFNPSHPLGREPLVLEHVPFDVMLEQSWWENLATYASLLTAAKPHRRLGLEFCSPTGFRRSREGLVSPTPDICLQGYLRKWNAFSKVVISEESLLEFVENHIILEKTVLHPAAHRLGSYSQYGFLGRAEWRADGSSPGLLRQVNALVDYALYCGTGMKTALGMGQTRRYLIEE